MASSDGRQTGNKKWRNLLRQRGKKLKTKKGTWTEAKSKRRNQVTSLLDEPVANGASLKIITRLVLKTTIWLCFFSLLLCLLVWNRLNGLRSITPFQFYRKSQRQNVNINAAVQWKENVSRNGRCVKNQEKPTPPIGETRHRHCRRRHDTGVNQISTISEHPLGHGDVTRRRPQKKNKGNERAIGDWWAGSRDTWSHRLWRHQGRSSTNKKRRRFADDRLPAMAPLLCAGTRFETLNGSIQDGRQQIRTHTHSHRGRGSIDGGVNQTT